MDTERVTFHMEEEYKDLLDQMAEEDYFDSRSEGIIYALDRKLEENKADYDPVIEPDEEINQRFRELGKEYGLGEEAMETIGYEALLGEGEEFRENSLEFARQVLTRSVVTGDEEMEELAREYMQENFEPRDV